MWEDEAAVSVCLVKFHDRYEEEDICVLYEEEAVSICLGKFHDMYALVWCLEQMFSVLNKFMPQQVSRQVVS